MDCHIVRDKVQEGILHLLPISTQLQIADILTKPLAPGPFMKNNSKLAMIDIHSPACGGCHNYRTGIEHKPEMEMIQPNVIFPNPDSCKCTCTVLSELVYYQLVELVE